MNYENYEIITKTEYYYFVFTTCIATAVIENKLAFYC